MNIAMISGLLAAAGNSSPISGLADLAGTGGGIDFSALLNAAGKGQAMSGTELSAELQALFASAGKGSGDAQLAALLAAPGADASESDQGLNLSSLLSADGKRSEKLAALAERDLAGNEPGTTPQFAPDALLAAIAQALAGQGKATATGANSGELGRAEASLDEDSKRSAAEMATTDITPATLIPGRPEVLADASRSGTLATGTRGEDSPLPSANRPLFPVDRNTGPSANALAANTSSSTTLISGKDGESFAKSFAEAANTAANPLGNAAMTAATATPHRAHEASATPTAIASPLHDRSTWTQEFGDRIVWMAKQDQQSADIRITPANLGPVQISLNIEDGKASAVFASPHAEVRQAIEEALPRLREMLNGAGISLDQANVGSQMPQQQPENAARFAATPRSTGENAILPKDEGSSIQAVVTPLNRGRGLVDLFA